MKKHALDPFSLIFGLTFSIFGLLFVLTRADLSNLHLQWVWPVPIIVLGVLIIVMAARDHRRQAVPDDPYPDDSDG